MKLTRKTINKAYKELGEPVYSPWQVGAMIGIALEEIDTTEKGAEHRGIAEKYARKVKKYATTEGLEIDLAEK